MAEQKVFTPDPQTDLDVVEEKKTIEDDAFLTRHRAKQADRKTKDHKRDLQNLHNRLENEEGVDRKNAADVKKQKQHLSRLESDLASVRAELQNAAMSISSLKKASKKKEVEAPIPAPVRPVKPKVDQERLRDREALEVVSQREKLLEKKFKAEAQKRLQDQKALESLSVRERYLERKVKKLEKQLHRVNMGIRIEQELKTSAMLGDIELSISDDLEVTASGLDAVASGLQRYPVTARLCRADDMDHSWIDELLPTVSAFATTTASGIDDPVMVSAVGGDISFQGGVCAMELILDTPGDYAAADSVGVTIGVESKADAGDDKLFGVDIDPVTFTIDFI